MTRTVCHIVSREVDGKVLYCAVTPGEEPPPIPDGGWPNDEFRRWWPYDIDAVEAWRVEGEAERLDKTDEAA